ncbi:hypothetical protein ES703_69337 [subsurface metagenome]
MKTTGLVLEGATYRSPFGSVAPPAAAFEDTSRFGNNGVITNAVWVQLPSGLWVLEFDDGTDCDVAIPDSPSLQIENDFTISAWVNVATEPASFVQLYGKPLYREYSLYLSDNTPPRIMIWYRDTNNVDDQLFADSPITLMAWQHCVGTKSGKILTAYLNGVPDGSMISTNLATIKTTDSVAYLGQDVTSDRYKLNGRMALLKVHNYPLSAADVGRRFTAERYLFGV